MKILTTEVKVLDEKHGKNWALYNGDSIEVIKGIPDNSVGFSVFSPPFASLYTYSNSERDMGNCKGDASFYSHFKFLISELLRVTIPGRLVSFHCMNLPSSKERDGVIGLRDFRGELIKLFSDAGWIFHSEVCIWKDPVTAMQRTKALGLLHKQIVKDSCMSRQGIADYLVTMRKPGDNPARVAGPFRNYAGDEMEMRRRAETVPGLSADSQTRFSIDVWQRYASPVWMDIDAGRTLQKKAAREERDERHICPLQLDVIDRALAMWSNPGDVVLSPFAGIGSEGHQAIKWGRKYIGIELKASYFREAVHYLTSAEHQQASLV